MAIEAANIGANFSQYTGDPELGGFGLTQGRVDTRALEDLARYTMLYNKAEYDQRQKDSERAAEELAKFSSIDLSTSIPKDAKILQEKFDALSQYLRDNPNALNYRNRTEWLEYNKRKNDLNNDIKFATIRDIANVKRKNAIAAETNEGLKKLMESQLQENIKATDIRTPLDFEQKYDLDIPEIGDNQGTKLDVTKEGDNQIYQRAFSVFDVQGADKRGAAYQSGIGVIDPTTETGARRLLRLKENPWQQMSLRLNEAIAGAKDQNGVVDFSKLRGVPGYENIEAFNDYALQMRSALTTGDFTDRFGNKIKFHNIPFSVDDYREINISDGISAAELYKAAEFAKWKGDSYDTKVIQTDDAIQRANLAAEWERIGIAREQLNKGKSEDLISATAVLREAADVLKNGTPRQVKNPDGTTRNVSVISDPNLLREFGTIDKDGKTTNVPDVVYFDEAANKLQLGYYKRKQNMETNEMTVDKTKAGDPLIDRFIDMSGTQWLGQIVRRKNPNSDIGGVNSLIETFYNTKEVGRQLRNINKIYGAVVEGAQGSTETQSSSTTTPAVSTKKRVYKGLDANGNPIFEEQ